MAKSNKDKRIREKFNIRIAGVFRVGLVALIVLFQVLFLVALSWSMSEYSTLFYILLEIFSLVVIIFLVNDDKNLSYKLAWVCIILVLPFSGHLLYFLWGNRSTKTKELTTTMKMINNGFKHADNDPQALIDFSLMHKDILKLSNYMSVEHFPLYKNNIVNYYGMGEQTFAAMFKDFKRAKKFILIDFFIVANGRLWNEMHDILLNKINEGVKVMFMYDDFGAAFRTSSHFEEELKQEGFQVRVFNPVYKYTGKLYMNYRSHQKIVVVDGNIGYTGGMNIADEYANYINRFGVWKDNALRIEGDGVWGLTVTFLQMWDACSGIPTKNYDYYRPDGNFIPNYVFTHVISDGPANNPENPIENIYKMMISSATKYCYITTPYLIIEDDMRTFLDIAVKSGIDVRIITPAIPDKKTVKMLTNYNYGPLLRSGVRIYEYSPGFIHAKTIVTDKSAIVGTINMDYRSFYLHYECGLWVCSDRIVGDIRNDFLSTLKECHEITYEEWKNRPLILKIYQSIMNPFQTLV